MIKFKSLLTSFIVSFLLFHHSEIIKAGIYQPLSLENFAYAAIWIESKKEQDKLFGIGSNDGGKKYAIVTLDILGLPPNVKPQVIEKLNQKGWTEENIMLLPSHSHSSLEIFALNDKNIFNLAPIGIFQPQLLDFVVTSLADLIKSADQDLKPVKIGSQSNQIEGLNRNRRGGPFTDKTLTVTRIDHINGKPMTVLVNWTGHPTIMDEKDMFVSGGWPGYLQRELEGWIGQEASVSFYGKDLGKVIVRGMMDTAIPLTE